DRLLPRLERACDLQQLLATRGEVLADFEILRVVLIRDAQSRNAPRVLDVRIERHAVRRKRQRRAVPRRQQRAIELLRQLLLVFASPFGNAADFELSSSRGVSAPLAQTTTAFARWKISFLLASKYFTPLTRPRGESSILRTYELGRTSQRPVFTAFGITVTSE